MDGWKTAKLGEICELIKRGMAPKYIDEGGICVINQKCIRDHSVNYSLARRHNITIKKVPSERYVRVGDVLVNSTGTGTLGRVAQIRDNLSESITVDTHVTIVRPKEGVFFNEFFGYMLIKIEDEIASSGEGASGQTELARATLEQKFNVSYPESLPEQKRIVAILDEAFAGISRAVANAEKNLANARELFESYLNNVFTRKGEGWVEKRLGDTELLQIIDGDRGKNYPKKTDFSDDGYCLFLNTKNVRPDGFNFDTKMFITKKKDNALRKGKLQRRDVLLTTRGTIGNIAIYDDTVEHYHVRINSGMLIFRPNESMITSEFLFEIMRSSIIKDQITKFTSGAAQPQLPIKTLVNFIVPVPSSIKEQVKMVSRLQELLQQTKSLETIYQQKLTALTELKQSILQKAFSGELTSKSIKQKVSA